MAIQKQGMIFYDQSSHGYCLYYLSAGGSAVRQIKLTSEMHFSKAAKIAHRLNHVLFAQRIRDDQVLTMVHDYLVQQGADKYEVNVESL